MTVIKGSIIYSYMSVNYNRVVADSVTRKTIKDYNLINDLKKKLNQNKITNRLTIIQ